MAPPKVLLIGGPLNATIERIVKHQDSLARVLEFTGDKKPVIHRTADLIATYVRIDEKTFEHDNLWVL